MEETRRVINGTWGEAWLDQEKLGECTGLQSKMNFKKEDIPRCGTMATDKKIVGWDGTGSLKMNKVNSRLAKKVLKSVMAGKDVRFTIITKLADPDSHGVERAVLKGVSFDDLTISDWAAGTPGTIEAPFTFSDIEYLDQI